MKKILTLILVAVMLLTLVSCGAGKDSTDTSADTGSTDTSKEDSYVIGVTLPDLTSDGYAANVVGIKEEASSRGNVEIQAVSAENSAETQTSQIEDFITNKVDGIIILPVDSAAMASAVSKAENAGIKVVCMDRSVEGDVATAIIESDNYTHGAVAAQLMLDAAKDRGLKASDLKVLELLGDQASSSGLERHEGFADKCEELGITIVSSLPTYWNTDEAYNATLDAFQSADDINAIFEASDIAMHSGVSSALEQIGKYATADNDNHIIITSVDGGPNGVECVSGGYIDAIAQQSLLDMGTMALEVVINAIDGKTIDETHVQLSPVEVTKDNADSKDLWTAKIG